MSTASMSRRAELRRADRQDAGAAAVVEHALAAAAGRCVAIQRRHMRVVGWVPVPKARPGSSRITCARLRRRLVPGRHDPEVGRDLDRRELRLRQAHPVLLGHGGHAQHAGSRRRSPATAAARPPRAPALPSANSAITRERCQPSFGGGMPGSPNSACSASVCASASSTETLSASSASSASLTVSTRSSGASRRSSNTARAATVQRLCAASHSSR